MGADLGNFVEGLLRRTWRAKKLRGSVIVHALTVARAGGGRLAEVCRNKTE